MIQSLIYILIFVTTSVLCNVVQYRSLPNLAGKTCPAEHRAITEHADSAIICGLLCATNAGCQSMFYKQKDGTCHGCNEVYNIQTTGLETETDTIYYRESNLCGVSDNCHNNAHCTNTPGSFTCACRSGYSGDGVTFTACTKYGDDFTKYENRDLTCSGTVYYGLSESACLDKCKNFETCRTAAVNHDVHSCKIRTCDPIANMNTNPDDAIDLYVRHCS